MDFTRLPRSHYCSKPACSVNKFLKTSTFLKDVWFKTVRMSPSGAPDKISSTAQHGKLQSRSLTHHLPSSLLVKVHSTISLSIIIGFTSTLSMQILKGQTPNHSMPIRAPTSSVKKAINVSIRKSCDAATSILHYSVFNRNWTVQRITGMLLVYLLLEIFYWIFFPPFWLKGPIPFFS